MSRIGKKPVSLPSGVKAEVKGSAVQITGPKGTLNWAFPIGVQVAHDASANAIKVSRSSDSKEHRAKHGMARALINNMVEGVTKGYERKLEVYGTGYGCSATAQYVELNVGFSNPVRLPIPKGVKVTVEVPQAKGDDNPAKLTIAGIEKQVIGQFAREIKDARPPEPYKGKGVRYAGEQIRRKAGKAFAGAGAG